MTFALTKVRAYGIEAEEVVNKRYLQHLILNITAANTDTALDLGSYTAGSLGTFWDAVDATATGLVGLQAIRDIATRADAFIGIAGTGLNGKTELKVGVIKLDSAATAGGNATETCTVTGLLTTDELLSVCQFVDGAGAAVGILAWGGATGVCSVADQLSVTWNADPGAGAKVRVAVRRAATAPVAGTYLLSMSNTLVPSITFLSGDAPTAYLLCLSWVLKDKEEPVSVYAAA